MLNSNYILNRWIDSFLIIGCPLLAWIVSIFLIKFCNHWVAYLTILITHAHLVIVFFRSHGNSDIRNSFKKKILLVPPLLFLFIFTSDYFFVFASFIAIWWDTYHSSLQTFGIGRIYDMKNKNSPTEGRRLDIVFNLVIYSGPVLAGATLLSQVENSFSQAMRLRPFEFKSTLNGAVFLVSYFRLGFFFLSLLCLFLCLFEYRRWVLKGYQIPIQKLILYSVTGFVTFFSWGWNSFGEAFLAMNMFHSVQYFVLMGWAENKNIKNNLSFLPKKIRGFSSWIVILSVGILYGHFVASWNVDFLFRISRGVALLHFWFDSFIWSVRSEHFKSV